MLFAKSTDYIAYIECKSVALTDEQINLLAKGLCQLMEKEMNISQDRIYIEFTDISRSMWGFKGKSLA